MGSGILEVTLIEAKGLANTDFLNKMDPYVIVKYKNQERKSRVARDDGRCPVWNEKFTFRVDYPGADDQYKLVLNIMDKDTFSSDDFVGQATIQVKNVLELGLENGKAEVQPTKYRVILSDRTYCGEITVGISFTTKVKEATEKENYGGWRYSSH